MSEIRRGAVVLIQRGDPQIAGAIAEGMLAAKRGRSYASQALRRDFAQDDSGSGQRDIAQTRKLPREHMEIVKAEIDRQRVARLVRIAVGNDNTAEDYQCMIVKARHDYGRYNRKPGPLRRLGGALLGVYALLVCGVSAAYRSQDRVLGKR